MKTKWSQQREQACIEIANKAAAFVWLFNETRDYYRKLSTVLIITLAICNILFGSSGILSLRFGAWSGIIYVMLVIQVMIILTGALGAVFKALNFDDKILKCEKISLRFSIIHIDIEKELKKDVKKRIDFDIFYERINSQGMDIKYDLIHIPNSIHKKYESIFKEKAIAYKDLFISLMVVQNN